MNISEILKGVTADDLLAESGVKMPSGTRAVKIVATSGGWAAITTCDSGLMIPDLVSAISSRVLPKYSW